MVSRRLASLRYVTQQTAVKTRKLSGKRASDTWSRVPRWEPQQRMTYSVTARSLGFCTSESAWPASALFSCQYVISFLMLYHRLYIRFKIIVKTKMSSLRGKFEIITVLNLAQFQQLCPLAFSLSGFISVLHNLQQFILILYKHHLKLKNIAQTL